MSGRRKRPPILLSKRWRSDGTDRQTTWAERSDVPLRRSPGNGNSFILGPDNSGNGSEAAVRSSYLGHGTGGRRARQAHLRVAVAAAAQPHTGGGLSPTAGRTRGRRGRG